MAARRSNKRGYDGEKFDDVNAPYVPASVRLKEASAQELADIVSQAQDPHADPRANDPRVLLRKDGTRRMNSVTKSITDHIGRRYVVDVEQEDSWICTVVAAGRHHSTRDYTNPDDEYLQSMVRPSACECVQLSGTLSGSFVVTAVLSASAKSAVVVLTRC